MVSKSLDLWARSVEMPTDWLLMLASAEAIHSSMLSAWTPLASLEPKGIATMGTDLGIPGTGATSAVSLLTV